MGKKERINLLLRLIALALLICIIAAYLISCDITLSSTESNTYKVTFEYNNGEARRTETVREGYSAKEPLLPEKAGYTFVGWYLNDTFENRYYFGEAVKEDITLYAAWERDISSVINRLTTEYMTANVEVVARHYSGMGFFPSPTGTGATGSGAIYKRLGNYYYVLTNCHVIDYEEPVTFAEYTVYDAYGNEYESELLEQAPEYDLAVLRFYSDKELKVFALDTEIPDRNETVFALGQPQGQNNALTVGEITNYTDIADKIDDESLKSVTFSVLWHTAFLDHGSSGGALVNADMKLVGLNYASSFKGENEFQYGFAVPSVKIKEFLDLNGLY